MRLLGNFPSQLNAFYYANLLGLTTDAIALGEYAGGSTFDASSVAVLQAEGQDLLSLAIPGAGSRTLEDSINTPLTLLDARYRALLSEVTYSATEINALTAKLEDQTVLLDQVLAFSDANLWSSSSIPKLGNATSFCWSFVGGYSPCTSDISLVDPPTGLVYPAIPPISAIFDLASSTYQAGLSAPVTPKIIAPKSLKWTFLTDGQYEETYGPDWANLDILEFQPRLIFSDTPVIEPNSAGRFFNVMGSLVGGSVPIFTSLIFIPRTSNRTIITQVGVPLTISPYRIEAENTVVLLGNTVYYFGVDFTVTSEGFLTSVTLPAGVPLIVQFEEYYPAYQCSIDQQTWSSPVMLDANRPYPEGTTVFNNLGMEGGLFPLTDGMGVFTGLMFNLARIPSVEMIFSVTTPASENYGMPAQLEIDLPTPAYMTGLMLDPFATFPQILTQVMCQGVTGPPVVLFSGATLIDRPQVISFPRVAVRSLTLSFTQENYTLKQYMVGTPGKLRQDTLNSLQAVLPFSIQSSPGSLPVLYRGAQYQFGFENISGLDWNNSKLPGIFVTGPYRVQGSPEIVQLDLLQFGTVEGWVYSKSYASSGQLVDSNLTGNLLAPGVPALVQITSGIDRTTIAYSDFYVKFILRTPNSRISSFFLQVAPHV